MRQTLLICSPVLNVLPGPHLVSVLAVRPFTPNAATRSLIFILFYFTKKIKGGISDEPPIDLHIN